MLSVHGRREDGYHSLTSLVVPLEFGDVLTVRRSKSEDSLQCTDATVPVGAENLILKAAAAMRAHLGHDMFFAFDLEKNIPMGAGLGGGSSNAAVALRGMNQLLGEPFDSDALALIAAEVGSDCPFFIQAKAAVMRGRGEIIEPLDAVSAGALHGKRMVLFRPDFGVDTGWAYRRLSERAPDSYESEAGAQARLERFFREGEIRQLLYNSFEGTVGEKYLAIMTLLEELRAVGVPCLMSGSGSCCFAVLEENSVSAAQIRRIVHDAWGNSFFWVETSIS